MKRIKSYKGIFGQIEHFENGVKIGESWQGMFEGSYKHYDADGSYMGRSDRGFIADQVHRDEYGSYIGETHTGLFAQKKHYSENGFAGKTWDDLLGGTTTLIDDDLADPFDSPETFDSPDAFEAPDPFDDDW